MSKGLGFLEYDYESSSSLDDYFGGGGGGGYADSYYSGGGGGGGIFDDYDYDYFFGGGGGDIPYAEYDPGSPWPIDEPFEGGNMGDFDYSGGGEVPSGFVDLPTFSNDPWVVDPGYSYSDPLTQWQDYYAGVAESALDPLFNLETSEPINLPNVGNWPNVPYTSFDDYAWPFYELPVGPIDVPPPPPPPITQQSNLPPACPQGSYHPYPIGHPQQNVCTPFPQAQTPKPQQPQQQPPAPKPPSGSAPKPQQQPKCPEYCRHPQTGQWFKTPSGYTCHPQTQVCTPISGQQQQPKCPPGQVRNPSTGQCVTVPQCPTPGTVFDARTGRCVPFAQAQQPLCPPGYWPNLTAKRCEPGTDPADLSPSEVSDLLEELKKLPWWLWAALGGFLLLNRDSEESKKVTIQHRRAS